MNNNYFIRKAKALLPNSSKVAPSSTPTVVKSFQPGSTEENIQEKDLNTSTDAENALQDMPITKKRRMEGKNRCFRCLGCACCLPLWATCIVWAIVLAVIITICVIGGKFSMPTIQMVGITTSDSSGNSSQVSFSGDSIDIDFGLIVQINNPNVFNIDLKDITATAYYPTPSGDSVPIGGGYLSEHYVPKYSNNNMTFPFALEYNPLLDTNQFVLTDLVSKCGLSGGPMSDITVDYTIKLTAVVLSLKIHPTISSSATFPCPIDAATSSLNLGNVVF